MKRIEVIGKGYNGSRSFYLFECSENRITVITDKPLSVIADEISRRYPDIVDKVVFASEIFEVDKVKEIDISKLQPQERSDIVLFLVKLQVKVKK